jgi:hypothetical protein
MYKNAGGGTQGRPGSPTRIKKTNNLIKIIMEFEKFICLNKLLNKFLCGY